MRSIYSYGMKISNIFTIAELPQGEKEIFETLAKSKNVHIERIISSGQTTPQGEWYDSAQNEWVVLLQGEAHLETDAGQTITLAQGDYILIPAGQKHRVVYTSKDPYCIWLAIHFTP